MHNDAMNMLSGCIEVMIMHPLDLIKTRFQLQNSSLAGGAQYTGVRDCARKMYAQVTSFRGWSSWCHFLFTGRTILVLEGTASPNPCGDTKESLEILYI